MKLRFGDYSKRKIAVANTIKIITQTPKFWNWHNYVKSHFQFYKAVFIIQNHAKKCFFWRKFWRKI